MTKELDSLYDMINNRYAPVLFAERNSFYVTINMESTTLKLLIPSTKDTVDEGENPNICLLFKKVLLW